MKKTLPTLRRELEQAEKRLARLEGKTYSTDVLSEHFHLGMVGGSGKPVQKLNRQRERVLDQRIDDAHTIINLAEHIRDLKRRIAKLENPPPPKPVKVKKVVKPRLPDPVLDADYLQRANELFEQMETFISLARGKMHGITWNDPHDHILRGENAAYIEVQAVLVSERMKEKAVTINQLKTALTKLRAKCTADAAANPNSAYLPYCSQGLDTGIAQILATLETNTYGLSES